MIDVHSHLRLEGAGPVLRHLDLDLAGKIPGVLHIATDRSYGPGPLRRPRPSSLSVVGVVGPHTRAAMATALHGSPAPAAALILRRGDRGQAVRVWQTDLNNLSTAAGRGGGLGSVQVDGGVGAGVARPQRYGDHLPGAGRAVVDERAQRVQPETRT